MQTTFSRRYNKTFCVGNVDSNACVGNNGWVNIETYEHGFDEAVGLIVEGVKNGETTIDCIIYPIVFCARHRIELFLKEQLYHLRSIRNNKNITDIILSKTHDLKALWNLFKDNAINSDRRFLNFISESEEYIMDFAEIDLTGETFRYPYSTQKTKHLVDTPIINIDIFFNRYSELSRIFKNQAFLMSYILGEYKTGTYTQELSRNDIYEIAKQLPKKNRLGK